MLCISRNNVTNEAPVLPPPHHQREHSPEYWLTLFRTPIPISPHTWDWLHTHLLIIRPSPYKHTTHTFILAKSWFAKVIITERFFIDDCLFCCDLDCFSFLDSLLPALTPDDLFTGLWFSAACPDSYLFTGLWFYTACPDLSLYCSCPHLAFTAACLYLFCC